MNRVQVARVKSGGLEDTRTVAAVVAAARKCCRVVDVEREGDFIVFYARVPLPKGVAALVAQDRQDDR